MGKLDDLRKELYHAERNLEGWEKEPVLRQGDGAHNRNMIRYWKAVIAEINQDIHLVGGTVPSRQTEHAEPRA